ncbi:MAG: hypothetical protein LBV01_02365 [Deltaproteobacteria bacterium]|nr:hypothetical protein [Deltaproteobacteria bacterium]
MRALPVMTFAGDPACAGSWTLRHAVSLTLAEDAAPLSFTGLLRLDAGTASIHAVGLGGMGFTLFDLTVARDTFTARFLHPSVVRLPGAAGHIAAVLRRLWLGGPRGPLRRAVFSDYGDEALGPWPRRVAAEGDGFALEILLLEARANYP